MVLHWGNVFKLNVTSLRFFNIYGIRSRTTGSYGAMFGVFLAQKINNKNYTVVGNGRQKRDFIYISDVVEAILKSSRLKKKNLVLNIGSGKCYSINYIVKLLGGKKTYLPKRPGEPDITWSNIKKAKKILNWKPNFSGKKNFYKGIYKTCEWFEKNKKNSSYKSTEYTI